MSDEFFDGLPTHYSIFLKSVDNTFTQSFYIKSGFILIKGLPMDSSIPYIWFLESYLTYAASMLYKEYIPFYGPNSGKLPADTASPRIVSSRFIGPIRPTTIRRNPSVEQPDDYYSMIKKQKLHNIEVTKNLLENNGASIVDTPGSKKSKTEVTLTLGGKKSKKSRKTKKSRKPKKTHFV